MAVDCRYEYKSPPSMYFKIIQSSFGTIDFPKMVRIFGCFNFDKISYENQIFKFNFKNNNYANVRYLLPLRLFQSPFH